MIEAATEEVIAGFIICEGPRICVKMWSTKGIPGHLILLISGFEIYDSEIFNRGERWKKE